MASRQFAGKKSKTLGDQWEKNIKETNARYAANGTAFVDHLVRVAATVKGGMVIPDRSGADFTGFIPVYFAAGCYVPAFVHFEAKHFESAKDGWSFEEWNGPRFGKRKGRGGRSRMARIDRKQQLDSMHRASNYNCIAFVLVQCTELVWDEGHLMHTYPTYLVLSDRIGEFIEKTGRYHMTLDELRQYGHWCEGSRWLECLQASGVIDWFKKTVYSVPRV